MFHFSKNGTRAEYVSRQGQVRRNAFCSRLRVETLEERQLLATISGIIWNDMNASGVQDAAEGPLAGWNAYLDLNDNSIRDGQTRTVNSTGGSIAIPDLRSIQSPIVVAGPAFPVSDVNVTLSILHTYDADLDVFLISPQGTRVELFTDVGGSGDNFTNTTLDDQASRSITAGSVPFNGVFRPEGSLATLNGQNAIGTWNLEVRDDQSRDVGTLLSWSLTLAGQLEPLATTDANGRYTFNQLSAGSYRVREVVAAGWQQTIPASNGGYLVSVTESQTVVDRSFGNRELQGTGEIRGLVWNDQNRDRIKQAGESVLPGRSVFLDSNSNGAFDFESRTIASPNVPRTIADLSTITSTINVTGFGSAISDVNVSLTIQHTYDRDLEAYLQGPSGARVLLFSRVGGSGDDFQGTTFDDEAALSITSGTAPFLFSFRPQAPLSAFDGQLANGTWTLQIRDLAAEDVGSLVSWSLNLTGASEPAAITDASGNYSFRNLPSQIYSVRQVLPSAWQQTLPADGAPQTIVVNPGQLVLNVNFGSANSQPNASLLPDMYVWADATRGYLNGASIDTQTTPGRRLLRFDTAIANLGSGPMELRGSTVNGDGTQDVLQRIYNTGGTFTDRLAGRFVYHSGHGHVHFDNYADYQLRAVTANGGVGDVIAASLKTSFCLIDIVRYPTSPPGTPSTANYTSCGQVQGISVGWVDVYDRSLPGQYIDVTNVSAGTYWLEVVVDPANLLQESNESNNVTRVQVQIPAASGALLLETTAAVPLASGVAPLTQRQLDPIVAAARLRMEAVYGTAATRTLVGVRFAVSDLPGRQLGLTTNRTVLMDVNAAGFGWFVDATPNGDSEFRSQGYKCGLSAKPGSAAINRADLLTAVLHEMGHLMGIPHNHQTFMSPTLTLGQRLLPSRSATRSVC